MIPLTFDPVATNCDVTLYADCPQETIASEFLPTRADKPIAYQGRGLYVNEAPKSSERKAGVTEETTTRVVDIYPKSAIMLKPLLKVGAIVCLTTNAYGVEDGYLEGVQSFDNSNHLKLVLCLSKS